VLVISETQRVALGREFRRRVRGEVWFDGGRRAIYATDSSNYRLVPLGVVCPRDEDDVAEALRVGREAGAPVVCRGGGTSLAGQACNEAVVLDLSRHLNRIIEIDPQARSARVEPGVVLDDLRAAGQPHGITFGPDPATHAWCTIGGMIGNNSCGTHALYTGKTVDNVIDLAVLTYGGTRIEVRDEVARWQAAPEAQTSSGRIFAAMNGIAERYGKLIAARYPVIPRRVSGYNLDELLPARGFNVARALVGSESTCVVVTQAVLALAPSPAFRRLVVLGYPDIYTAADHVPGLLEHELLGLEGFDVTLVEQMRAARLNTDALPILPPGEGWLLAEVGADDEDEAQARALDLATAAAQRGGSGVSVVVLADPAQQRAAWRIRESGLGATARPKGRSPNFEGWEDAAVAPARLGEYLRRIRELWGEFGYSGAWYGHFGQGCVHTRNDFDFSSAAGVARFRAYVERAADVCVELGGSLSGEHGDGQARGELLGKMFGPELLGAFREFKAAWDPDAMMNPGKVIDARPLDADLHYGPGHRVIELSPARFAFSKDGGRFQAATQRCVGVGACRRTDTGVMCPSYRVTGDERHSTRGRAKLLGEMLQGEATPATWRNRDVFEALELCLSCKGCAVDCPTRVDMATYKAEFLSHYYAGRLRPVSAYALGLIGWWARVGTRLPGVANALLGDHVVGRAAKRLAGVSSSRPAPSFAPAGFRRGWRRRPGSAAGAGAGTGAGARLGTVVVWPDTFSDAFWPGRATATVAVLEGTGESVAVPARWGCCGRPLYDFGMLHLARRALSGVLDILGPWIGAGVPVVVPEPSCLAVFRDELPELLADDPRAARLAGLARSLAEHLDAVGWVPDSDRRAAGVPAYIHPHCHQRAIGGSAADVAVLERVGYQVRVLDSGCCGLAGSFGFRREHDAMSRQIAADRFVPLLAGLPPGAELVIDGFSCATQALHLGVGPGRSLAEVVLSHVGPPSPVAGTAGSAPAGPAPGLN
jgi:FAD/FMN-containing dehydrogenase/Fe-S oxidoreductase